MQISIADTPAALSTCTRWCCSARHTTWNAGRRQGVRCACQQSTNAPPPISAFAIPAAC